MDDLLGFRDDEEENGEAKGLHVVLVLVLRITAETGIFVPRCWWRLVTTRKVE